MTKFPMPMVFASLILGLAAIPATAEPVIALYPKGVLKPSGIQERVDGKVGDRTVRNVSQPTLEIFRPAAGRANGTAVIVAPGGGFKMLSYDNEGTLVAKRLAQRGVTAFVLKYRLAKTPDNGLLAMGQIMKSLVELADTAKRGERLPVLESEGLAAEDASRAISLVRSRAREWGVNSKRIGMLGFSAGAITTANVATTPRAARPDFIGLIYGMVRNKVPSDAPPAFIAAAADDTLLAAEQVPAYQAWRAAGRPAELHLYERGGHGFGMSAKGTTSDRWIDEFMWWLESRDLIQSE